MIASLSVMSSSSCAPCTAVRAHTSTHLHIPVGSVVCNDSHIVAMRIGRSSEHVDQVTVFVIVVFRHGGAEIGK
jgi:hypothetical protein